MTEKEGPSIALLEELLDNAKKVLAIVPSTNPDPAQKMSEDVENSCWWQLDEKTIATKYLKEKCGTLHLSWVLDRYWGMVTENYILPSARLVYDALVKKGHDEKKTLMWGDADGHVCYIPCKDRKVFVHTTQNIDFLYIIDDTDDWGRFDVRRIYRSLRKDDCDYEELMGCRRSFKKMLEFADSLMELHDDHYRYSQRHSLEAYRKVGFKIPYHPANREKERDFYGDFRDGGYVLSYEYSMAKYGNPKVEGSKYVIPTLETLATCWLPSISYDLDIVLPKLPGYDHD